MLDYEYYYYGSDGAAFGVLHLIFVIHRQTSLPLLLLAEEDSRDKKNNSTILCCRIKERFVEWRARNYH